MQFFTLYSSNLAIFESHFFDSTTTHNDHSYFAKHVPEPINMVFGVSTYCLPLGGLIRLGLLRGGMGMGMHRVFVPSAREAPPPLRLPHQTREASGTRHCCSHVPWAT